jgi:Kef-type K+ transport system membrane component KefB
VLTATSVSISAQTLMELGRLRSREGTTLLGAAVIDDVLGIVVLSLVIAWSRGGSGGELALLGPRIVGFFVVATALGLWLLPRLLPRVARIPATQVVGAFALAVCFVYAWGAEAIGSVAAITGSYLAGVLFARTEYRERVGHTFETLGYAFLVPIFFLSIGLQAQAQGLAPILAYAGVVVGVAVAAKAVGCALGALVGGFGAVESVRVGVGMISRGEVALIAAAIGHEAGVLDDRLFAAMVVMALATTMVTPVLLKFTFTVGGAPPAEPRHVAPSPMEVEGERPAPRG